MRALFLTSLLIATPAAAAEQQFDLICKGKGFETRYRVDLERNEACSGKCERVWRMGEVSSGQLKLIEKIPTSGNDLEERATVNRVTGVYSYMNHVPGLRPTFEDGICSRAAFTGFPTAKF